MLALISSDVLKLRRRRGMIAISLLLTAGLMAVAFIVMAIQHGGNPARYGPAGGLVNFKEDIEVISLAALVIGTVTGGLAAVGCIALAGSVAAPGPGAIAAGIAAVLAAGALSAASAVGVSAL